MEMLISFLGSINWWFVLGCVVISMLLGMVWYSQALFGNYYMAWMKFPPMSDADKGKGMVGSLVGEAISRILYFIPITSMIQMESTLSNNIIWLIMMWLFFVVSTQLSQVMRSMVDKRVLLLLSGKILVETLLALALWQIVFMA